MIRIPATILLVTLTTILLIGQDLHSTKVLKINGYTDKHSINLDYDSALVSFSLQDVRDELIKLKSKKKYQGRDFQNYFSEALTSISADNDYIFNTKENLAGGTIEQYVLRTLISKGKSKVLNKTTNRNVDKIKKTHYRVSTAGESHEGYEFSFMNGTVFLIDRISI